MNTSLVLMSKLIAMMLIGAVGFITVRSGLLEKRDSRQLAKLSLYALGPCLIISAFQVDLTAERMHGYLIALLFALLVQAGFILLAYLLGRRGILSVTEELSVVYTNCGNLILPIVSMTMGPQMVFYGSAYQLIFNLLFWTNGVARMQDSRRIDWKKVLFNPNILAVFAGIFLTLTGISLPGPVDTAVDMMAGTVGAVSMLVIGMALAGSDIRGMLTYWRAYPVLLIRLIVFPLLAMAALCASGFLARCPQYIPVLRISFMAIAAPPGANVAQLAVLYDKEPVAAGIYNMLGMLLCVLTIPFVDFLFFRLF